MVVVRPLRWRRALLLARYPSDCHPGEYPSVFGGNLSLHATSYDACL